MIVVDTSVWIDLLTGNLSPQAHLLKEYIENKEKVALTDISYAEILMGIHNDNLFSQTKHYLQKFDFLPTSGKKLCEDAASLYRECKKKGKTVRSLIDCLIAASCVEGGHFLLHRDRDFESIASVSPLKLLSAKD